MMLKRLLLVFAAVLLTTGMAIAQSDKVEITADSFVVNEGAQQATFTGNVVIIQPGLKVWANKVVVHYGEGGPSDLQDFEATGNVRIQQPDQTASGDRGLYNPKTKILRLRGNVRVTNASGTVTGPELVVNLVSGISEFTAQPGGRVTGIFTPQE